MSALVLRSASVYKLSCWSLSSYVKCSIECTSLVALRCEDVQKQKIKVSPLGYAKVKAYIMDKYH